MRRPTRGPGTGRGTTLGFVGTMAVHLAAAGVLLAGPSERTPPPPTVRVSLVAAPKPAPRRRRAPDVIERQAEAPAPVVPKEPSRERPQETPEPVPREAKPEERPPPTTPDVEPLPEETPSTGSDIATVDVAGVAFAFPEYLDSVVREVYRRWARPSGSQALETELRFTIHRDGSVSDLEITKPSGNFGFDLEARGAVEAAGRGGAFGPLPDGYPSDILVVQFYFTPRGPR